ncbi:MAG: Clp1/GlmU family protein, partial [Actinomycetota bacterium]
MRTGLRADPNPEADVNEYEALVDEAARTRHTVVLVGGLDTGKSTLSRSLLSAAVAGGRAAAYLDADVGQKTVGPPATITLKNVASASDLEPEAFARADALAFVGSIVPEGHLLAVLAGVATLHRKATEDGADFVVVDTSALVSGISGEILKYHKVELLRPDLVVGLQRGEELLPLLGVIQRFFDTQVVPLGVHPSVVPSTVDQRADNREQSMRRYFSGELHRFRVKPTVFLPALPPLFDLANLHRLLVGLSDGAGAYTGLGYLEHAPEEGVLRLISPVAAGPK